MLFFGFGKNGFWNVIFVKDEILKMLILLKNVIF